MRDDEKITLEEVYQLLDSIQNDADHIEKLNKEVEEILKQKGILD